MGRSPKIVDISTGKVGKEKKLERKIREERLKKGRTPITDEPPAWLSKAAAEEYVRVVHDARKADIFDSLDTMAIAIYADAYARYVDTTTILNSRGIVDEDGNLSPFFRVLQDCTATIMRCSTKLGLFATDRLKLVVPTAVEEKQQNKFIKYIDK